MNILKDYPELDRWEIFRTCIGCVNIRKHLCPGGWFYGFLRETVQDCLGFDYTDIDSYPDDDEDE